jgi:ribose transport system ATP-binding protein
MWARAAELFARLGVQIDPTAPVQDLTTGYQQIVEIAKALSRDARVLIMDEPSAPLTTSEVEAMFNVVATLKEHGVTVIYISHRLEEIFRIADRVSVLRDGKFIRTLNVAETNKSELIELMVGRELSETFPPRTTAPGEITLRVSNLCGNGVREISFEARRGEILGFAGLVGAGRTELMEMLFGVAPISAGEIELHGRQIRPKGVVSAISSGLALVPEDRKRHGVILDLTIRDNISLPLLRRISTLGVVRRREERAVATKYQSALSIKTPSLSQKVGNLSGGNQQKVVLAKWLAMDADTLIFDEPTRGIDVGAREEIYMIMNDLAAEGKTLIMISSDMEELLGMSDRIVVLCRGRLAGTLVKTEFSQERILTMASGAE